MWVPHPSPRQRARVGARNRVVILSGGGPAAGVEEPALSERSESNGTPFPATMRVPHPRPRQRARVVARISIRHKDQNHPPTIPLCPRLSMRDTDYLA